MIKNGINSLNRALTKPYLTKTVATSLRAMRDRVADKYAEDINNFDLSLTEEPSPRGGGIVGTIQTAGDFIDWFKAYKELEARLAGIAASAVVK